MSTYFNNKLQEPTDEMLALALGDTKELLDSIGHFIEMKFGDFHPEWKYYGTKFGWSLKLFHKKRNVVFVEPEDGYFGLAFAIGEKAFKEIMESEITDSIKNQLTEAKVYVEGRPLRLEIRSKADLEPLWLIISIKLKY